MISFLFLFPPSFLPLVSRICFFFYLTSCKDSSLLRSIQWQIMGAGIALIIFEYIVKKYCQDNGETSSSVSISTVSWVSAVSKGIKLSMNFQYESKDHPTATGDIVRIVRALDVRCPLLPSLLPPSCILPSSFSSLHLFPLVPNSSLH